MSVLSDIPKRGIKLDTWLQNKGLQNENFFTSQSIHKYGEAVPQIVTNLKQRRV